MKKYILNIAINQNCSNCGICHLEAPEIFSEDNKGNIHLNKRWIFGDLIDKVENTKEYCLPSAIDITSIPIAENADELLKEIRKIVSNEINCIKLPAFNNINIYFDDNSFECPISFSKIVSKSKYITDGAATNAGLKELKIIYNNNIEAVSKAVLIEYRKNILDPIINRNNYRYIFKSVEERLNNSIETVSFILNHCFNIHFQFDRFEIDNQKLDNWHNLNEFDNRLFFIAEPDDMDLYVSTDYDGDLSKYRYILEKEDIETVIRNVVTDNFYNYYDSILEYVTNYYNSYVKFFTEYINKFKTNVFAELKKYNFSIENKKVDSVQFKEKIEKISQELINRKQDWKEGSFVTFDTNWDSSYRFVFRRDAEKAAERRTDRMEREYTKSFTIYAESLGKKYSDNICKAIIEYLRELQKICIEYNLDLNKKFITISLDHKDEFSIRLNDSFISDEIKKQICSYITDKAIEIIDSIDNREWFFSTVDDSEIYAGETIFGNSKFVKKYNYWIDDLNEKQNKCQVEQRKMDEILYKQNIPQRIYIELCQNVKKVIFK